MGEFTSAELALNIEDFSRRILQPAIDVLAAQIRAANSGEFRRLRRNYRRRELYAQRKSDSIKGT